MLELPSGRETTETRREEAIRPASGRGSPPPPVPLGPRPGVAVLRPGAPLVREQLLATLKECRSALDPNIRSVADGVAASPHGDIDLLAVDRSNRLVIIDLDTKVDDGLLLRGIAHIDWLSRNLSNVKRMYPDWIIDAARSPRLFLVAPRFSGLVASALRQLPCPDITCFRYHEAELSGRTVILIESVRPDD